MKYASAMYFLMTGEQGTTDLPVGLIAAVEERGTVKHLTDPTLASSTCN